MTAPSEEDALGVAAPPGLRAWLLAGLRRGGTHWMVVGSLVGGVCAYLFQVVGTRALREDAYAPIGVLWTIQYLLVSVLLYAVETYVARQTTLRARGHVDATLSYAAVTTALAAMAVGVAGLTWTFRDPLFGGLGDLAGVAGALVLAYGALAVVRGTFAGTARFQSYGLVTGGESLLRLLLSGVVLAVGATTRHFAWIMPVGAALAAVWILTPRRHQAEAADDTVQLQSRRSLPGFLAVTTTANAAAQLLLAGGPLLLPFLGASPAELSVFFITVTAARVPLVFALGGLLSRLLPTFTRMAAAGDAAGLRRAALTVTAVGAAVSVGAAALAALAGSPVVALFFGRGFAPPWWLVTAAAGGVLLVTTALLLNQILIARGAEGRIVLPWVGALLLGLAVVTLADGSPSARVTAGFVTGSVSALATLAVSATRRHG